MTDRTASYVSPLALVFLVLTALVTAAGFVLVPAGITMPVHWGVSGEADAFASREVALLLPLVLLVLVWALFLGIGRFAPGQQVERSRAMSRAVLVMISALFFAIAAVLVLLGMGVAVSMVQVIALGVGLLLVVLGNAMPKSQPNGIAGLRIPSTLADAVNWQQTHRLTGRLMLLGGLLLVAAALIMPAQVLIWAVLACVLVPIAVGITYSKRLAARRPS